jgi:hypothetical protein
MKSMLLAHDLNQNALSEEVLFDDETRHALEDFSLLESHIVYFAAGKAPIKEILIKTSPSFSL